MIEEQNNRNKANVILIIVLVLFIITTILKFSFKHSFIISMLAFIAEASLVGGIADWFAVTALFKKPLGFSWHTAIIPNNREIIIEKVSQIVSDELLSADSIKMRLSNLNFADIIIDKLSESMNKAVFENQIKGLIVSNIEKVDKNGLSATIDNIIKTNLKKEGISDEIKSVLHKSIGQGKHRQWLSQLLDKAVDIARQDSTRERIYHILKQQEKQNEGASGAGSFIFKIILNISHRSEYTNLLTISQMLQEELVNLLKQINDPNHPIFNKVIENAENLVNGLDNDNTLINIIQVWKNGILENVDLLETLQQLITVMTESQIYRDEAAGFIAEQLDSYKDGLKQNTKIRELADDFLKSMLDKVVRNEHYIISEVVKDTLESFTDERLNQFIEDKAGNDLQWIRINGSIVGAAAGLLIFFFTNLLYAPYIAPALRGFFGIN